MTGKTVNQVVAANARRAMAEQGWSDAEVAKRLSDVGLPQTRQNVNKKFRSESGKESAFTANELLALSLVFDKPILWFLLPQPHHRLIGAGDQGGSRQITGYLDRLFADPNGDIAARLGELGASEALAEQRELRDRFVAEELSDLGEVEETLRRLADRFSQASHEVHKKLAHEYSRREEPK
jgi:hypothetical protein